VSLNDYFKRRRDDDLGAKKLNFERGAQPHSPPLFFSLGAAAPFGCVFRSEPLESEAVYLFGPMTSKLENFSHAITK
jgi:hypothetical protein